jgi:hypothetical protein
MIFYKKLRKINQFYTRKIFFPKLSQFFYQKMKRFFVQKKKTPKVKIDFYLPIFFSFFKKF